MLYKNLPRGRVFPVLAMRLILDGIAGLKFLTEGGFGDFVAVIKAHFQFYGLIMTRKIRRKGLPHRRQHEAQYNGLIVWDHYVLGKKKFSELHFNPENNL